MSHTSVSLAQTREVHIFSDSSEKAIAASAYLSDGITNVRFIIGRSKLVPFKGHTIRRLELYGGLLATELAEIISILLGIPLENIRYYTDSRVVLGYIGKKTRRFYTILCKELG